MNTEKLNADEQDEELSMTRYIAMVQTPVGRVPMIGATMSPEREREVQREAALHSMVSFGLEPSEDNIPEYFRIIREVLK